jgi:hypothetical protein
VLAKYELPSSEMTGKMTADEVTKIFFKREIAFMNNLDPSRYFKGSMTKREEFKLVFHSETENKDTPFEVQFNKKHSCLFFDVDTIAIEKDV